MATPTAITPKVLKDGVALTASTVLEYTVPAATTALGVVMQVTNPKSMLATYKFTAYVQPSGAGNDAAADLFCDQVSIPADGVPRSFVVGTMEAADFIRAKADTAAKLNLRIIGDEAT